MARSKSAESPRARRQVSTKRSKSRGNRARRAARREARAADRASLLDEIHDLASERGNARADGDGERVRKLTVELNGRFAAVENASPWAIDLKGDEAYLRDRNSGRYAELRKWPEA
jgi:hypothetical protein